MKIILLEEVVLLLLSGESWLSIARCIHKAAKEVNVNATNHTKPRSRGKKTLWIKREMLPNIKKRFVGTYSHKNKINQKRTLS